MPAANESFEITSMTDEFEPTVANSIRAVLTSEKH